MVRIFGIDKASRESDPESDALSAHMAELGGEVLAESRTELMMAFRFLDTALWHLPYRADEGFAAAIDTDGTAVSFGPLPLLARYMGEPHEVVRDYLHLLLHCVFRHPFDTDHPDATAWSLACDIVVEGIALEMVGLRWGSDLDAKRRRAIDEVLRHTETLNPFRVYRLIHEALETPQRGEELGVSWATIDAWIALFYRDPHALWACPREGTGTSESRRAEEGRRSPKGEGEGSSDANARPDEERSDGDSSPDTEDGSRAGETTGEAKRTEERDRAKDESDEDAADSSDEKSAEERAWEEIAKQVEMALAEHQVKRGEGAGALALNLALATQPPIDYAEFLRKFATISEEIRSTTTSSTTSSTRTGFRFTATCRSWSRSSTRRRTACGSSSSPSTRPDRPKASSSARS